MSAIGIAYTPQAGGSHNVLVDTFTGAEVARAYDSSVEFERGVSGQQVIQGRPGRQKYIWAISAVVTDSEAQEIDDMFQAWDLDRSAGHSAAVGINDQTVFAAVATSGIFSTPPSYIRMGPHQFTVSFGLTEV